MHPLVSVELVALLLLIAFLIYRYSASYVSILLQAVVYLAWLGSFSIVLILPLDIFYSLDGKQDQLSLMWKINYWGIFILTWLVLPLLQQYQEAGEFTTITRIKRAVKNNLLFYLVLIVVGVVGVVVLLIKKTFSFNDLLTYAMAAANTFGLFLVVICLSHGLTQIPKSFWRSRSLQISLRQLMFQLADCKDKKQELLYKLQQKVGQLKGLKSCNKMSEECNKVLQLIPEQIVRGCSPTLNIDLNQKQLIKIHSEVKLASREYIRMVFREKAVFRKAFFLQDVIRSSDSQEHVIQSNFIASYRTSKHFGFLDYLIWLWHCKVKSGLYLLAMIASIGIGALIVIAELSIFVPAVKKGNPIGLLLHIKDTFLTVNIVSLIFLSYISYCVYSSLFQIKLAGYYGLHPNRQTDGASLLFSAINCTRVTYAICYNFLQLSDIESAAFTRVMGKADIFPVFGANFRYVFPILLLILTLINSFDLYSKILNKLGLKRFVFSAGFNHEKIQEGRQHLARARLNAQNLVLDMRTTDLKLFKAYDQLEVFFDDSEIRRLRERIPQLV